MKPVKMLYVCDPAKAETCRKSLCKQNPYCAAPICDCTVNPEWAKTDAAGNPIIDWENTLLRLKHDCLMEVPSAVPYEYTARIELSGVLVKLALCMSIVEALALAVLILD